LNDFTLTTSATHPIKTDVSGTSFNSSRLKTQLVVTIVVIVVAFICISIFAMYKVKQYKSKNKNINELEKEG